MKKTIFDIHGGRIDCDVCGEHSMTLIVQAEGDDKYEVLRNSLCYGHVDRSGLSREETLTEVAAARNLMHIRTSIEATRTFERQLKAGKFAGESKSEKQSPFGSLLDAGFLSSNQLAIGLSAWAGTVAWARQERLGAVE